MSTAKNDFDLAKQLGTNRKGIARWRTTYPREAPRTRDVEAWRGFMRDNLLGPYSPQRQHGEAAEAAPAPPAPTEGGGETVIDCGWRGRRGVLAEVMELLHAAYADGEIDLLTYVETGSATMDHLCELAKVWKCGIDLAAWRRTWNDILRGEALKLSGARKAKGPRHA